MSAPPREAPPQDPPRKANVGGIGGRRPGTGGGGEPTLFDKVSNFVADSGTIAVLKVSLWFGLVWHGLAWHHGIYTCSVATAYILES